MRAPSSRPFCSCNSRWVSLQYLSAGCRYTAQRQLDELYAVLRGVKDGEISEDNAIKRLERSRHWV
jgi:hypothetical protein